MDKMDRPYVFCHMLTSLDGRIDGKYMDTPQAEAAIAQFYSIAFGESPHYQHQGWLSGRITTDDNFTFYRQPRLDSNHPPVPPGDYIAGKEASMYYVSVDPSGKLGWESGTLKYNETTAQVIEILTEKASPAYKAFLRQLGISYLLAGDQNLDYPLLLHKLKTVIGIQTLMLGGGGSLNWSFIQAGMCDELSLLLAPLADGSTKAPGLFTAREGLSDDNPITFNLENSTVLEGGSLWLRYLVNK